MPLPKNGTLLSLVQIRFESRDKVLDKNSKTSELCLLSRKMQHCFWKEMLLLTLSIKCKMFVKRENSKNNRK